MFEITKEKLTELQNYKVKLERILLGFRRYERSILDPAADAAVAGFIAECVRLLEIINTALAVFAAALKVFQALADSDYPALPRFHASQVIKKILTEHEDSEHVANDQVDIEVPHAQELTLTAGPEIEKR